MKTSKPPQPARQRSRAEESPALHRSGAVARMLRMPVATLRVWERRYGLTQAELSPSGQRLYSADDVRRLALIKQLTELLFVERERHEFIGRSSAFGGALSQISRIDPAPNPFVRGGYIHRGKKNHGKNNDRERGEF